MKLSSLDIWGRVFKLPVYLLMALFGTAKLIDSLVLDATAKSYWPLIVAADLFLLSLAMLEIDGIIKAWKAASQTKPS